MLVRENEINQIRSLIDQPVVKLFAGMRGCGKTTLMDEVQQELRAKGIPAENIISLDLEARDAAEINTARRLQSYIRYRMANPGRHYVFLDEIQNIPQWEQVIAALAADPGCDLYLAASDVRQPAALLAEVLPERFATVMIFPLSYAEYRQSETDAGADDPVSEYLKGTGLPLVVRFRGTPAAGPLLHGTLQTILLQDVMLRARIRDGELMIRIFRYILQYLGKPFAVKSIADYLKKRQRQASAETIANHLSAMEAAGLIWRVPRYDIKAQTALQSTVKYYLGDHGLAVGLSGPKSRLESGVLENIVYLELLRRHYDVYVGKIGHEQVDFLAMRDGRRLYVQIATEHADLGQLAKPLLQIRDQYPKLILCRNMPEKADIQGIRCLEPEDFLTGRDA